LNKISHLSLDSIVKNNNFVTDMINGAAYSYEKDTYNLILFADAANYTKSGNKSHPNPNPIFRCNCPFR
jgi:predicted glycosyltransferase involved in capsule biosynthesis